MMDHCLIRLSSAVADPEGTRRQSGRTDEIHFRKNKSLNLLENPKTWTRNRFTLNLNPSTSNYWFSGIYSTTKVLVWESAPLVRTFAAEAGSSSKPLDTAVESDPPEQPFHVESDWNLPWNQTAEPSLDTCLVPTSAVESDPPEQPFHLRWNQIHLSHLLTAAWSKHLLWNQIQLSHLLISAWSLHLLWNQIHLSNLFTYARPLQLLWSLSHLWHLPGPYICCGFRSIWSISWHMLDRRLDYV